MRKWNNNVITGGLMSTRLQLGADAIIGIASAGASALGQLFGGMSKAEAEREAQKRQIEADMKMQANANSFTEKMWNAENEYNTPEEQRKRWEEAGFNPYMMQSNNGTGTASSVSGAAGSVGTLTPATGMGEGISKAAGQAVDVYNAVKKTAADANKADAEATGQQIDNITKNAKNQAEINRMEKDGELSHEEAETLRATRAGTVKNLEQSAATGASQEALNKAQTLKTEFETKNVLPANVAKINQEIDNLKANKELTMAQKVETLTKAILNKHLANKADADAVKAYAEAVFISGVQTDLTGALTNQSYSQNAKNWAEAGKTAEETKGVRTDNASKGIILKGQKRNESLQKDWYDYNEDNSFGSNGWFQNRGKDVSRGLKGLSDAVGIGNIIGAFK